MKFRLNKKHKGSHIEEETSTYVEADYISLAEKIVEDMGAVVVSSNHILNVITIEA